MLASFLLALREGLEAALIIGIVLGALRKMNRPTLKTAVWRGVVAAIVASIIAALALTWLGAEFEGTGEQIFEGTSMLIAAILLTWMIVWMRRQSATLQKELETDVREALGAKNGEKALFWLAFLAVGREGLELALFLVAAQMASGALQSTLGAVLGLAGAAGLGWLLFASSRKLSLRQFFNVTNILLVLFAAGLLARGVHEFNEAHLIPEVIEHVWNLTPILSEESTLGQLLATLFGYSASPSLTMVIAYVLYFLSLGFFWNKMSKPAPTLEPAQS
jgi:high-affinity iron transporter